MSNTYYSPAQAEARLGLSLDDIIATERSATAAAAAAAKKKVAKAAPAKAQQQAKAPNTNTLHAKRAHAPPAASNNKANRDRAAPYPKRDRDRDYPPERSHRGGGGGGRDHGRNDYDDYSDHDDHRESWRERTASAAYRKSFDQPPAPAAPQPIQFTIVNDRLPSQQGKKNGKPKPKGKGKASAGNRNDDDGDAAPNAPRREQSASTDGSAPPPTIKKHWNKRGKRGAAAGQQADATPSTSTASAAPAPARVVATAPAVATAPVVAAPTPGGVFPGGAATVIMAGAAPHGFHAAPGYAPHQQVQYITSTPAPVQYYPSAPPVQYVTYPGAPAAGQPMHVMPQGATIAYAMPSGFPHPM